MNKDELVVKKIPSIWGLRGLMVFHPKKTFFVDGICYDYYTVLHGESSLRTQPMISLKENI